jgi:hypothetical protein
MVGNKTEKSTFVWNSEKKRPSSPFIVLLIVVTISFLVLAVLDSFASIHEIKIVFNCDQDYNGEIQIEDDYYSINTGDGLREFTYQALEGKTIEIYVIKLSTSASPLTVSLYDNGELVDQRSETRGFQIISLDYTVKDRG